jgi:hypothetical protein
MRKKTGMFWHVHHDILLEYCHSYDERKNYIVNYKSLDEQELRLKLFKPIKGELPEEVQKAWAEYDKTWTKCDKARAEYDKVRAEYDKAGAEYDKAWAECYKAWAEYDKAWTECDKAIKNHLDEINKLHAEECPDCPWNGETIFP